MPLLVASSRGMPPFLDRMDRMVVPCAIIERSCLISSTSFKGSLHKAIVAKELKAALAPTSGYGERAIDADVGCWMLDDGYLWSFLVIPFRCTKVVST